MNTVDYRKVDKVFHNGIKFDSVREKKRYQQLLLLEKAGLIKAIEIQPVFPLVSTFKKNGVTYRGIKYVADFCYWDCEKDIRVVEDVKGFATEVFKIKHKLFEWLYPDLTLTILKKF